MCLAANSRFSQVDSQRAAAYMSLLGLTSVTLVVNLLEQSKQSHSWQGTSKTTFSLCNGHGSARAESGIVAGPVHARCRHFTCFWCRVISGCRGTRSRCQQTCLHRDGANLYAAPAARFGGLLNSPRSSAEAPMQAEAHAGHHIPAPAARSLQVLAFLQVSTHTRATWLTI